MYVHLRMPEDVKNYDTFIGLLTDYLRIEPQDRFPDEDFRSKCGAYPGSGFLARGQQLRADSGICAFISCFPNLYAAFAGPGDNTVAHKNGPGCFYSARPVTLLLEVNGYLPRSSGESTMLSTSSWVRYCASYTIPRSSIWPT
jgi:hypothetical protein